jgi:hypothetical protein
MALTLTKDELIELTGKKRATAMARWLQFNGFSFRIGADGYPRVDRGHYQRVMSGGSVAAAPRHTEPDFEAMRPRR